MGRKLKHREGPPGPQVPPYLCVSVPLPIGSERAAIPLLVLTSIDQDKLLNAFSGLQVFVWRSGLIFVFPLKFAAKKSLIPGPQKILKISRE